MQQRIVQVLCKPFSSVLFLYADFLNAKPVIRISINYLSGLKCI